jgi:hypothetical protein
MVRSQIASLTPGPSFAHNLGCRCPNDQCEGILDIYTSRPFQWHQKHPNARCFGLCCRTLNEKYSKSPTLGVGISSSHFTQSRVATLLLLHLVVFVVTPCCHTLLLSLLHHVAFVVAPRCHTLLLSLLHHVAFIVVPHYHTLLLSLLHHVAFIAAPCYFRLWILLFLFLHLITFVFAPYYFCFHALLLLISCPICFRFHTLLLTPITRALLLSPSSPIVLAFTPYYSRLVVFAFAPYCFFLGTSCTPHPSHCCFVALLFIIAPCYSTLLVDTPSPFSYASGGTWTNTNKLHSTTKVFFPQIYWAFFFLLCSFFEFNTICSNVVCEF